MTVSAYRVETLSVNYELLTIQVCESGDLGFVGDEIHVWRVDLDGFSPDVIACVLSKDEVEKARRFRFERHQKRFIVARSILRILIGVYLGVKPQRVVFGYGKYGKPHINMPAHPTSLKFNVAHSDSLALYALSKERELGVDIEIIRDDFATHEIAERFFSPNEIVQLRSLPDGLKTTAFFNCWTRKESFIKARGEGLSLPLDKFDVSVLPNEPAALLSYRPDNRELLKWSMQDVPVETGFKAALTSEGDCGRLRLFNLK